MNLAALIPLVLKASVFLFVFAIGLGAHARDVTYMFRHPGKLFPALLAVNVLMPLFAVALALLFDLNPAVKIALVVLALCPLPPVLPKKLAKAGATESYAVGLLVALAALAIVFIPLALEVMERVFGLPLHMTAASVAKLVVATVLLPIGLGVAIHSFASPLAERMAKPVSLVATIGLLLPALAILFSAWPAIWSLVGNGTLAALVAFVVVGLAAGHLLGGPEPENRTALAISTASRHPGIAVAIAQVNFPEEKLALAAVLLYLLVNALASAPYMMWAKRRAAKSEGGS